MSTSDVVVVVVIASTLGLCYLVTVCLRGTEPDQRPTILHALGEVLRSLRPFDRTAMPARGKERRRRHRLPRP